MPDPREDVQLRGEGTLGVALTRLSDGRRVLQKPVRSRRFWVSNTWEAAELAPYRAEKFRIDVYDYRCCCWGWLALDSFTIPAFPVEITAVELFFGEPPRQRPDRDPRPRLWQRRPGLDSLRGREGVHEAGDERERKSQVFYPPWRGCRGHRHRVRGGLRPQPAQRALWGPPGRPLWGCVSGASLLRLRRGPSPEGLGHPGAWFHLPRRALLHLRTHTHCRSGLLLRVHCQRRGRGRRRTVLFGCPAALVDVVRSRHAGPGRYPSPE